MKKKPQKKKVPFRHEEFRETTDDWYPCFNGNQVQVSLLELWRSKQWRVCVWGADDCGMEIDVASKIEAEEIFNALPRIITKKDLKDRGFYNA